MCIRDRHSDHHSRHAGSGHRRCLWSAYGGGGRVSRMFPTVGRFRHGYHQGEVDSFFALARRVYERSVDEQMTALDVRAMSFDLTRGGYTTDPTSPSQV